MKKQLLALSGLLAVPACALFAQTVISSNITTNTQWTTAGSPYIIQGIIYVTGGATLDIAPGVLVRGQPKSGVGATDPGTLIIARGSKIQARGTASSPVVFTTAALDAGKMAGGAANGLRYDAGNDGVPDRWTAQAGLNNFLDQDPINTPLAPINSAGVSNSQLWGSLVLLGNASHNARADSITDGIGGSFATRIDGIAYLEGQNTTFFNEYGKITHTYDGSNYTDVADFVNDDDSSGSLNYVSLRHGGFELTPGKELNGLTLAGVGRNTTVRNIEIYCNSDDGIEIFGGTVNVSYAVISFVEDDAFDVDQGHRGTCQFIYVAGHGLKGDSTTLSSDATGFEFDGDDANESGNQATTDGKPYQNTIVYNATVQVAASQANFKGGVNIRRGFRGDLVNSIISGNNQTATYGINVDTTAAVSPSPFVRQSYADRLINIRNTTINNFPSLSSSFTATPSAGAPFEGVSTSFVPSSNTGTGVGGLSNVLAAIYPTTSNSTNSADLLVPTIAASGFNPRPGAGPGSPNIGATGVTQAAAYVKYPAVTTSYRGAFNPAATTLWTTGWTALNKANTNGIKLLVD